MKKLKFPVMIWNGSNIDEIRKFILGINFYDGIQVEKLGYANKSALRVSGENIDRHFHGQETSPKGIMVLFDTWFAKVDDDQFIIINQDPGAPVEYSMLKWTGANLDGMRKFLGFDECRVDDDKNLMIGKETVHGKIQGALLDSINSYAKSNLFIGRGQSILKAGSYFILYRDDKHTAEVASTICV